jgi:hypothetical protein
VERKWGKIPHYHFSWIVTFQKQRYICKMLPLDKKNNPEVNYSPIWISRGSGSGGNIEQQVLQQKRLQRKEEGTAQLQDFNVEFKNLESKRQIGKFEKGNAEE